MSEKSKKNQTIQYYDQNAADFATLARDVQRFAAHGYRAVRAAAVDMFPRTANVETVVALERRAAD